MKTKKTILNYLTDTIPILIISILGIFKIKLFIQVLGSETLGLYQLFTQVIAYIAIVDGGLATAVLFVLYKPNMNDDTKKINEILSGAYKVFSFIGCIIFLVAAIIALIIPLFIKNLSFPYHYVVIAFLLYSFGNVISYFFVPVRTVLEVKEKKYITNLCLQIGYIIQKSLDIVFLLRGFSFYSLLIMHSIIKLLSNLVITIIFRKKYPEYTLKSKTDDFSFVKKVKDLFFHKINWIIGANIDVIIISKMLGLTYVAIYSTYFYIINTFMTILGKISSSIYAIVGNKIAKSSQKIYGLFLEINSFMFFIGTIICVPLLFALNDFINIWYDNQINTSMILCIAFVTYLFCFIIKETIATLAGASGLFKETKICAISDTIINLTLSIFLVHKYGIQGVLFATAISLTVSEFIMKNIIIHKYIFKNSIIYFYLRCIKYFGVLAIDVLIGYFIFNHVIINDIFEWFVRFTIYTILNAVVVLFIYKIMGEASFLSRFIQILKKSKTR